MHKPALDLSWFAVSLDAQVWLLAVWLLGLWCMDHEAAPFAQEAWAVQQQIWSEETDFHVVTAPMRYEWPDLMRDLPSAPAPTDPPHDPDDAAEANMIRHGWPEAGEYRGHPPRVAIYRVGPRLPDAFLAFGDYVTWRWIW